MTKVTMRIVCNLETQNQSNNTRNS